MEMNKGIYPPSLKFKITYNYGKNETHKRMAHKVSVTGCDEEDEVAFKIDVYEPPTTPLGVYVCIRVCVCGGRVCGCVQARTHMCVCVCARIAFSVSI